MPHLAGYTQEGDVKMLEEKKLKPEIHSIDSVSGKVQLKEVTLIMKDGVEITRITNYVYVDTSNPADVQEKIGDKLTDELEYVNKLKARKQNEVKNVL